MKEELETILTLHDRSVEAAVRQMDAAYTIKDYEYGKQLMLCKSCHAITNEDLMIVEFHIADDYLTQKYCKACNGPLKILDISSIEHVRCPKCLKYGLKSRRICDWK